MAAERNALKKESKYDLLLERSKMAALFYGANTPIPLLHIFQKRRNLSSKRRIRI